MSMAPKDLDRLNIGKPDDVGGTETQGTVNAKLNTIIRHGKKMMDFLDGEYLKNFGDGRMGHFIYGETQDAPFTDEYNRRIYYTESFTIPAGKIMNVSTRNNGMVVWSRGDIAINGTLDISSARDTGNDPNDLPTDVVISEITYPLAVGGTATNVPAGMCGIPGKLGSYEMHESTGALSLKAASVSGGKLSAARRVPKPYPSQGSTIAYKVEAVRPTGAGALVLIAAGKITINGSILATGPKAYYERNGQNPSNNGPGYGGTVLNSFGGGGAVTLIAGEIDRQGTIDVSGHEGITVDAGVTGTGEMSVQLTYDNVSRYYTVTAGTGAKAYTCGAGLAGNIKEYLLAGG